MTDLSPQPKFRATIAGTGIPLVGGKLYTYKAGTSPNPANYQTTFKDSAGTANTNPVILNSYGECDLWLSDLPYKYVLTDVLNNILWTVDNITTSSGAINIAIDKLFVNSFSDIATTNIAIGQVFFLKQHTSGEIGGGDFIGVSSVGLTPDGGLISATTTPGVYAKRLYSGPIHSDWFGCYQAANQTVALNNFLLNGGDLVIDPYPSPYMIDPTLNPLPGSNFGGLDVQSNTNLEIPPGTNISSLPASVLFTCTIKVYNKTNVKIFGGGRVRGEKSTHIGVTGEHGMGILVLASTNVTVENVAVDNCWGDCVYTGRATISGTPTNCRNVTIKDCELYDARRQGISAVSVNVLKILGNTIHGITGIAPGAAIDLEPDAGGTNTEVTISNNIGYDCDQGLVMQRSNINVTGSGNYFKSRGPALAILDEAININAPGGVYEGGMDGTSETISLDGTGFVDFSSVTIGSNVTAIGSGTNGVLKVNSPINRAVIDGCTLITKVAQVPLISNEGENFFYNNKLILSDLAISGASKTIIYSTKGIFGNNKFINATIQTPSYLYLGTTRIVQPEIKLSEDPNTLNDWRSAKSWAPSLTTTGTNFTSVTLNANSGGTYTKIGDLVFIEGQIRTTALTVGAASGDVVIGNLPFPAVASTGATLDGYGSVCVGQSATWGKSPLSGLIISGENRIRLFTRATFAGDCVASAVGDVTAGAGNIIFFSAVYKTTAT